MNQPRLATKEDMSRVYELIKELAIFEKEPDAVEVTVNQLIEDGFGDEPKFVCFVVEIDDKVEGLALIYTRYSTWKGEVIHLEDLIVSQALRGKGLGTVLLDEVVKYGKQKGVKRISWEVLDWNESAIEFYEKKGANVMRDWDVVQMDSAAIDKYISKL
ncbi:GNAT family N-acetyltransferase [Winogradskyella sp. PC-19]|uniref:GNAT family N-acetyltransferase n=1 Tax=unclassified Winogradskyella TaxID=2615021 RepID=UPI000B3C4879|nr:MULTISPECIES: GNAT family N-acetyltransferase [unclassified Winogradskyella]ARV09894.1 GNAT family N-acetyltransferase [Winogradskyella sp. PC-19]RZN84430.1 MAG: GNAT family N-acetyltransferase [Winogradskyella sp.]